MITSDKYASGSALVWLIRVPDSTGNNAQLLAYDAVPTGGQLALRYVAPIGQATKFTPPGVGPARIYVGTRDGHLLGFGVPAAAALTSSLTDFGSVLLTRTATSAAVLRASQPVVVESVTASDAQFRIGTVQYPAIVDAGASFMIPITFTPVKEGILSASLHVVTNLGSLDFSLVGTGISLHAQLQASPGVVSLGGAIMGSTLAGSATLTNSGGRSLILTGIIKPAAPFYLVGAPTPNTVLGPGQSMTIGIQFRPDTLGSFKDTFQVVSSAGTIAVNLSGSATPPGSIRIDNAQLDFGQLAIGSSSTLSFSVVNTSNSVVTITKSKPPSLGQFTASDSLDEGVMLGPGETRTLRVSFSPTDVGQFSDSWTLNSNTQSGLQELIFHGIGVAAGAGSLSLSVAPRPDNIALDNDQDVVMDWVHYGLRNSSSIDRMADMPDRLPAFEL